MTTTLVAPPRAGPAVGPGPVAVPAPLLYPQEPMRGVLKILIAGGFGAGKSSLVRAVSQLPPITCDVALTTPPPDRLPAKLATTSALDFGRLRLRTRGTAREVIVCLFGTPGLDRFWPGLWPDVAAGAVGAVVVVDPRDVAGCFAAVDHCEHLRLPFLVLLNRFPDAPAYAVADVRQALGVHERVPIESCDVRHPRAATAVVASLVEHALASRSTPAYRSTSAAPPAQRMIPTLEGEDGESTCSSRRVGGRRRPGGGIRLRW